MSRKSLLSVLVKSQDTLKTVLEVAGEYWLNEKRKDAVRLAVEAAQDEAAAVRRALPW